mmetsp:Transcript_6562/g.12273  ORF Transcript_6562/g.12273 Transcript_6562/m.12273 type:complete len:222 (+) Transcript_6562:2325-2990(+)
MVSEHNKVLHVQGHLVGVRASQALDLSQLQHHNSLKLVQLHLLFILEHLDLLLHLPKLRIYGFFLFGEHFILLPQHLNALLEIIHNVLLFHALLSELHHPLIHSWLAPNWAHLLLLVLFIIVIIITLIVAFLIRIVLFILILDLLSLDLLFEDSHKSVLRIGIGNRCSEIIPNLLLPHQQPLDLNLLLAQLLLALLDLLHDILFFCAPVLQLFLSTAGLSS